MSSHTSLSTAEVHKMLELGVEHSAIIERLVETGDWSKSGANEIVRFMTRGARRAHENLGAAATTQAPFSGLRAGVRRGSWA